MKKVLQKVHGSLAKAEFKRVIDSIKTYQVRHLANLLFNEIPEYFWTVPASSSGKYHPEYALNDGGLVRHVLSAVAYLKQIFRHSSTWAQHLKGLTDDDKTYIDEVNFFKDTALDECAVSIVNGDVFYEWVMLPNLTYTRDVLTVAVLFHDCMKSGTQADYEADHSTKFDHPLLMAEIVRKYAPLFESNNGSNLANNVADLIASHMGKWTTSTKSDAVLPAPVTAQQKVVHLADYLASRKGLKCAYRPSIKVWFTK